MRTKIDKFGFEIEQEMTDSTRIYLSEHGKIKSDGSIRHCNSDEHGDMQCLEFASKIYTQLKEASAIFRTLEKLRLSNDWHANGSCGFHVHISFKPKKPPELYSTQFHEFFLKRMKKKFPEEYEARKDNNFCEYEEDENGIVNARTRYKAINYSMEHYKTIEFRIFPSTTPKKTYEYLKFTLKTCDDFIKKGVKATFDTVLNDKESIRDHDYNVQNITDRDEISATVEVSDEVVII